MRDPTSSTVLYKILTPQEKADLPATHWAGTALDVSSTKLSELPQNPAPY